MTTNYRTVPTYREPLVKGDNTSAPWYRWMQHTEVGVPPESETVITPGSSPYTYVAPRRGFLTVSGGTVASIFISRSGTYYNTGQTSGVVPVSQGDYVQFIHSVAPTLTFFPT